MKANHWNITNINIVYSVQSSKTQAVLRIDQIKMVLSCLMMIDSWYFGIL